MKLIINRRKFLLVSVGATTTALVSVKSMAGAKGLQEKATKNLRCGKINQINLRKYYPAGTQTGSPEKF